MQCKTVSLSRFITAGMQRLCATRRYPGERRFPSLPSFRRHSGRVLLAMIALCGMQDAMANGATSQRDVNSGGGVLANASDGLRWWLGSNSQLQVNLGNAGQVYSVNGRPTSSTLYNSVYLRVDRGTNATARVYHNSDLTSTGSSPFTQVSQSAINGSGTAASPWQVTTVLRPSVAADNGITVTILDSYIRPQSWLTRRVTISGLPASGAAIKFYQNIDTFLQGGDNGAGFSRTSAWNMSGTPDLVGVIKGSQFEALWYEPSSGTPHWDRYFSGNYTYPGQLICRGAINTGACLTGTGDLNNSIDTNAATDNGMAAQWNVPAGASTFTAQYRISFAMGSVDLTKAFAPTTINAGATSTLTFNLGNRTVNSVASINFTDTLPADVRVAATPNIRTSCPAGGALAALPSGMTVTATSGGGSIQVSNASINGAASGGELVCQVAVDVTSSVAGQHHNTNASISGLSNLVNLVGDEVLTVVQAQLTASKSVSGTIVAGQNGDVANGHYLIGLQNTGSGPTTGAIQLVDTLPAGFSAVSASSTDGTVACGALPVSGTLSCTFTPTAPIPVNGTASVRINVAVAASASGSLTNVAAVAGGGDPDPLPTCPAAGNPQCAQVVTPVSQVADLWITKNDQSSSVISGASTIYQIVVTNNGPSNASNSVVRDPLPAGLTCSTVTCGNATGGAVCPTVSVAELQSPAGISIATLPAGASLTLALTCTVTATGQP